MGRIPRWILSGLFLAGTTFCFAEDSSPWFQQWEPRLTVGPQIYSNTAGLSAELALLTAIPVVPSPWTFDAGLGLLAQVVTPGSHTETDWYPVVEAEARWAPFEAGALAPLSFRTDLALGGGLTYDANGGTSVGVWGLLVQAKATAAYPLGSVDLEVGAAYQTIVTAPTVKASVIPSLSVGYPFSLPGGPHS